MGGRMRARPQFSVIAAALVAGLAIWIAVGAVLSGLGVGNLAYDLVLLRARQPTAFPLHMVTGGLGLMLVGAAIGTRRHRRLHRPLGRLAVVLLAVAAISAVPTAQSSLAPAAARAGFLTQGAVCLACLAAGWSAIRRKRVLLHRRLMTAAAATAFGAVVLRGLLIGVDAAGLPFEPSYAVAAWLAWLLPLAATAAWSRRL